MSSLKKGRKAHYVFTAVFFWALSVGWLSYRAVQRVRLREPLIEAVTHNDFSAVRALLEAGADPNARDTAAPSLNWTDIWQALTHPHDTPGSSAATALQIAAIAQQDNIARLLVAHGADVNAKSGYWPEYTPTVEVIYPPGGSPPQPETGYTALMGACGVCDVALTKLLLDNGADPNAQTSDVGPPMVLAITGTALPGGFSAVETTTDTAQTETKTEAIVRILLAHQANATGQAAVAAAMNNDWRCVLPLLQHGADVNTRSEDPIARTLTIEAAANNDPTTIAFLAAHGADLNQTDKKGRTALMELCHRYTGELSIEALKTLLEHGANPNLQDYQGITALMEAAGVGKKDSFTYGPNLEAIQLFLQHAADATLKDKNGRAVLQRMPLPALGDTYGQKARIILEVEGVMRKRKSDRHGGHTGDGQSVDRRGK